MAHSLTLYVGSTRIELTAGFDPKLEFNLFNEAEVWATPKGQEPEMETLTYEQRQTSGKREADLSKLPVETVTY